MASRRFGLMAALLASLSASCRPGASSLAISGHPPIEVTVREDWDLETASIVLAHAAAMAGLRGTCGLVWGSVIPTPSFRLAIVQLPEELVAWLACDPDLERAWAPCSEGVQSCNPLTKDGGLVGWHRGKLVGAHASDMSALVEVDAARIPEDGHNYALVIGDQPRIPAVPLLRALRSAAPGAIVLLPLDVHEPPPPSQEEY